MKAIEALSGPIVVMALLIGVSGAACGPDRPGRVVEPAVRASCILLRALTTDGEIEELCATAEELAPLLAEILAQRSERVQSAPATPGGAPMQSTLAFALEAPAKRVPKRRCEKWVPVGAPRDGGGEAGDAAK